MKFQAIYTLRSFELLQELIYSSTLKNLTPKEGKGACVYEEMITFCSEGVKRGTCSSHHGRVNNTVECQVTVTGDGARSRCLSPPPDWSPA